jgi:hypothetical protein
MFQRLSRHSVPRVRHRDTPITSGLEFSADHDRVRGFYIYEFRRDYESSARGHGVSCVDHQIQ